MNINNVCKKINILVIISIVCSLFVNLYMSDKASVAGNDLAIVESQIKELTLESENLQNKYSQAASMSNLTKLAQENGFTDSQSEFYTSFDLALR